MSDSKDNMTRDKFHSLGIKARLKWLLDYYGIIAITVIAGAAIFGYLAYSIFWKSDTPELRIIVLDDHASYDDGCLMKDGLGELFDYEVDLTCYLPSNQTNMQAFLVRLTADDIDFIIVNKEFLNTMFESDYVAEYELLPCEGHYANAVLTGEETNRLTEDMFLVVPVDHEPEDREIFEMARNYFLN